MDPSPPGLAPAGDLYPGHHSRAWRGGFPAAPAPALSFGEEPFLLLCLLIQLFIYISVDSRSLFYSVD